MDAHDKPGLRHFLSAKQNGPILAPAVADHYCVPQTMRALGAFGQSLFAALGYPAVPPAAKPGATAGYSFQSWWEYLASVAEMAYTLPRKEAQLDWLDDIHEQAEAALLLMSKLVKAELFATESLRDRRLAALLPFDCPPACYLRTKVHEFKEDQAREARMRPFLDHGRSATHMRNYAHEIPLRSARHRKRKGNPVSGVRGGGGREEECDIDEGTIGGAYEHRQRGVGAKRPYWLVPKVLLLVSGLR